MKPAGYRFHVQQLGHKPEFSADEIDAWQKMENTDRQEEQKKVALGKSHEFSSNFVWIQLDQESEWVLQYFA